MKYVMFFCLMLLISNNMFAQNMSNKIYSNLYIGFINDALFVYPLNNKEDTEEFKKKWGDIGIAYPLLILNNVIIRDDRLVDSFRETINRDEIKSTRYMQKAEAEKKGITNVPKDGIVFVTTKRGYYPDFLY